MKTFTHIINDISGIHARPASRLINLAGKYRCTVTLTCRKNKAKAESLIEVMKLGAKKGSAVTVSIEGENEEQAFAALQDFFQKQL